MTLYTFTNDSPNTSACTGQCLDAWPPVTVTSRDEAIVGENLFGQFGVIEREDSGELQVTYNRWPLYRFAQDTAPGDATGHGSFDVWFVARPQTIGLGGNDELGSFFVGANGMTLYTFANDEPGVSNCSGDCLTVWPAFTVSSEDELYAGLGAAAPDDLGVIERADSGELQVTYQDMPLYFFSNDSAPGAATGHASFNVWFVVKPQVIRVSEHAELGPILTGSDGMTLYTFGVDEPGVSNCNDECATFWPPLTVRSDVDLESLPEGIGTVSTITRADGSLQIALNDRPLYYYSFDGQPGDTSGHLSGDVWFVAQPAAAACTISTAGSANLRRGPGTNFAIVGTLSSGQLLTVSGQAAGGDGYVWWRLENGSWVRSDVVTAEGDCAGVPAVEPPTAPTPAPRPTEAPPPATTEEAG
jgi:predicted lipoprotein with Yx(FWY)xxD motif